jgi:hypothetical protein
MVLLLLFFLKIMYLDLPVTGMLRRQLRAAEEHIRNRSRAAEGRWCCDKWQQSTAGRTTSKVSITQLQVGDKSCYEIESCDLLQHSAEKSWYPFLRCSVVLYLPTMCYVAWHMVCRYRYWQCCHTPSPWYMACTCRSTPVSLQRYMISQPSYSLVATFYCLL